MVPEGPPRRRRLRRSELATPASEQRMIAHAANSDADLVFLDLEDATAPSAKVEARRVASDAIRTLNWGKKVKAARINGLDTQWGHEDVRHLISECGDELDVIVVPKATSVADVHELDALVTELERKHSVREPIGFEMLIEDVRALIHCEDIAAASPRIEAIIFGVGDLSASQGMRLFDLEGANDPWGGDPLAYARNKIIVAARAAGVDAIDCPYADYHDRDTYLVQAGRAALLGAVGKWAIHPSQVALAHEAFTPPAEQVARARRMIDAVNGAEAQGMGAVEFDGQMVDTASAKIMQSIVDIDDLIRRRYAAV